MSSITISGDTSGTVAIAAPAVAGTNTMTLAAGSGTLAPKVLSTAVASTSGTAIDFTNIPSWVTRITVMLNGVSTNGTSQLLFQVGSGTITATGYSGEAGYIASNGSANATAFSTGVFVTANTTAASSNAYGTVTCLNISGNVWIINTNTAQTGGANQTAFVGAGSISLSGVLDRVRITTVNGTDTFDAGSINILYE